MVRHWIALGSVLVLATCVAAQTPTPSATPVPPAPSPTFFERFGAGINLGNTFEAPTEGAWGVTLEPDHLPTIAAAGFKHVRVPVKWSAHAATTAPYTIEPAFFQRIDGVVHSATENGLGVVLNIHHYDEIVKDPAAHTDRFIGLWRQIATRYATAPDSVAFELLNEPHDKLDAGTWNLFASEALAVVRTTNPTRTVIIGPVGWNNWRELPKLKLPAGDKHLVATFHYYDPFEFTHQGAEWVGDNAKQWLGRGWSGSEAEMADLNAAFDAAQAWGREHGVELYVGEFGAYSKADMASRVRWTQAVAEASRSRGMATAYWEFGAGFGAYDREKKQWREELKGALVGAKP